MWRIRSCSAIFVCLILILVSTHSTATETTNAEPSFEPNSIPNIYTQSGINETAAYGPPYALTVFWGWTGNLTYTYWDLNEDKGISNANVTCRQSFICEGIYDQGNGSYLVEVNTTHIWSPEYLYLVVDFDKIGFENQAVVTPMIIRPAYTDLVVFSPEQNRIDDHPYQLVVPLGEAIDIQFCYNDTEDSDGYVGGLEGAQVYARVVGPTLVEHNMEIVDEGNGNYSLTFDTTSDWLFEAVGGKPTSHELPYLIYVEFNLENREPQNLQLNITIIDIPTEFQITPKLENIVNDGQYSIFVSLVDIWPTHGGLRVQGLNITVECSDPTLLEVVSIKEDSPELGVYNITIYHRVPAGVDGGCCGIMYASVNLTIIMEKDGYERANEVLSIGLWSQTGLPIPSTPTYGPLIVIIALVAVVIYNERKKRMAQ